jgi:hypothetical protein
MFINYKWVVIVEKMELGNLGGEGEKCSLIIQVARMTLNIKGLRD